MAREKFENRTTTGTINVACKFDDGTVRYWSDEKANIINQVIRIVNSYSKQGLILTLRQLHYQFVSKDMKYVNHQTAYKKLGSILDDCRYSGLIDWNAIEDRGRKPHLLYYVDDLEDALQDTVRHYRLDRQKDQINCVEVWTEKDALSGIFTRATEKYHVRLVVNKGYTSSSAAYKSYQRFSDEIINDKTVTILYFGDHDPSGLDMIRDIKERLLFFLSRGKILSDNEHFSEKVEAWWNSYNYTYFTLNENGYLSDNAIKQFKSGEDTTNKYDTAVEEFDCAKIAMYLDEKEIFKIVPIGLTKEQIDFYDLPPNPTKMTDTRSDNYIKQFGRTCWEVDALDAAVLMQIIEDNIQEQIDVDLYDEVVVEEKKQIVQLKKFLEDNARDNEEEDDNN